MPIPFSGKTGTLLLIVLIGGILSIAVLYTWKQKFLKRKAAPIDTVFNQREGKSEQSLFGAILGTIAALIFLVGGGLVFYQVTSETSQFRALPVSQIRAVRISQEPQNSASFLIDDRQAVQTAIKLLKGCSIYDRRSRGVRETYSDGFRIELLFEDEGTVGNTLTVFLTVNPPRGDHGIVVPRGPRGSNLGDYTCPGFDNWVRAKVVPLFPPATS
jgi:hypothetical protein